MRPERVEVEIEEVVLHGFLPLDRHSVGGALQAELARLIDEHGLGKVPASDIEVARLDAGSVRLAPDDRDLRVGTGLAEATFRATIAAAQGRSRA